MELIAFQQEGGQRDQRADDKQYKRMHGTPVIIAVVFSGKTHPPEQAVRVEEDIVHIENGLVEDGSDHQVNDKEEACQQDACHCFVHQKVGVTGLDLPSFDKSSSP